MSTDEEMKKENQKKEEKKEIEVLEEKYEREDSETGYAQSMQETNLLKANRKYEVIANNLMGKYDENGHYTISQEILQELMLLKKIVGVKLENGLELKAFYKDLTFEFLLKFNGIDEEKAEESATLFLIERIEKVNGYIINKLLTSVGTYTAKTGEHFKDFCFQAFHVVKNVDDTSMGCLVGDALNIDKRIAYLLAVREASRNLYIELEEQYFNRRIAILDSIPQGTLILSEFAKKRALLEKYFIGNDRNKFRALNELLTSILESNPNIMAQMPVLDVMMTPLNSKYLESTLAISEKIKISEKYKALENFSLPVALPKPMVGVIKVATEGKKPAPKPKQSAPKKSAGGGKKSGAGGGGSKGGSSKKKGGNDKKKDNKDKKKGPKGPGLGFVKTSSKPEKKEETKKQKVSSLKFNTSKAEPKKEEPPVEIVPPQNEESFFDDFDEFDDARGVDVSGNENPNVDDYNTIDEQQGAEDTEVKKAQKAKQGKGYIDPDKISQEEVDVNKSKQFNDSGFEDFDSIPDPTKPKTTERERGLA